MVIKRLNVSMIQFLNFRNRFLIYLLYPKIIILVDGIKMPENCIFYLRKIRFKIVRGNNMNKLKETNLTEILKPYIKQNLWVALNKSQTKVIASGKTIEEAFDNAKNV